MNPRPSGGRSRVLSGVTVALALIATPSHANAGAFSWASAVSGFADETAKWNPNGLPGAADHLIFNVGGAYQVVFPSDVSQTTDFTFYSGSVTISMASPHTTGALYIGQFGTTNSVFLNEGTMNSPTTNGIYLQIGANSANQTFTVSGNGVAFTGAGYVGYGSGTATMNVNGGAQLYTGPVNFNIGGQGAGTMNVSGTTGLPFVIRSGAHFGTDTDFPLTVDGSLNINNGGFGEAGTDVLVAATNSNGTLNVGPGSILVGATSNFNVTGNLYVGGNVLPSTIGGHGEVSVSNRSTLNVSGTCQLGDVDGDFGHALHMYGGSFVCGGLDVLPPGGGIPPFDLRGGLIHVVGGTFAWPSGNLLSISSQVGSPLLWISNGSANTGPSTGGLTNQLMVGRAGAGTLRITQSGTSFSTGVGVTTLGDSTGGTGTLVADTSGTFSCGAYIIIGNHGTGEFDVLNGGHASCGATYISQQPPIAGAGMGTLLVKGTGSTYLAHDLFVDGGGNGTSGGPAAVVVDSGGTVDLITSGVINPPEADIFGAGTMTVGHGALFTTPGTFGNSGSLLLQSGEVDATSLSSSGSLGGFGVLGANSINSGLIDPSSATDPFATIHVNGTFQQTGTGHYLVYLGSSRRCDTLAVSGAVTLAGALDLKLDWSYVHTPGDTFTVMTYSSHSGTFSSTTWNGAALGPQAQVVYTANAVIVVITSSTTDAGPEAGPLALRFASDGPASDPGFALDLPADAIVEVKLYDVTGRERAALYDGPLGAGRHRFDLEAQTRRLSSGAYFARATIHGANGATERTARTILVR